MSGPARPARVPGPARGVSGRIGLGAVLALAVLFGIPGCGRDDEASLRARLDRWFWLGDTVGYTARQGCSAGAFRLVQRQVKSPLYLARDIPEMLRALGRHEGVALQDPALAPDAALVALANADRAVGMAMRRAALEGRGCMDPQTESAFRYALDNPQALLVYDVGRQTLVLLDPGTGLLIAARGAAGWGW